jgi:serine/threonine-protein kinase
MRLVADLITRLQTALADRYTLERELGRGGMATVYLARDLRHRRPVALKVLHPELAYAVGGDRFTREIEVAASLDHPHILPLFDSGEADGLLYYVMPYVEGESLRDRLKREGKLPLVEALQITREVADALAYAHSQQVVHRDIKPENILLSGGHARVADFGIARALGQAGTDRLTGTGLALGTPAYMSPEQASGDHELDGRTDVYSLGCVLYETLAGEPPYSGSTPQSVMMKRFTDPVPDVRRLRPEVPESIQQAISRSLAKDTDDRFSGAAELARALQPRASLATRPVVAHRLPSLPRFAHRQTIIVSTIMVVGLAVLFGMLSREQASTVPLDLNLVAVAPFRVASADPSLAYLREGMVDLLASKLTGRGGPGAADTRSVLSAWRRASRSGGEDLPQAEALKVAARVRCGLLLQGNVVGTPSRFTLNAAVLTVPEGRAKAQASVDGPADSLPVMVDHLAAKLLALGAGEGEQRLGSLTSTSLPALKAYLEGQALYRRGKYAQAIRSFDEALQIDSGFALAATGMLAAGLENAGEYEPVNRGERLAQAAQHRLNPRDQAYLNVLVGMTYANITPFSELLRRAERFVALAPDRVEAYMLLGQVLFAYGEMLGVSNAHQRAKAAFVKVLELDSTYVPTYATFLVTAARARDTAAVRRVARLYRSIDSTSALPDWLRWRTAVALNDEAELARVRARFDSMGGEHLMGIGQLSQYDGVRLEDAEQAHAAWLKRESRGPYQSAAVQEITTLALNRGRPRAALDGRRREAEIKVTTPWADMNRVTDALYWDGDTLAAAESARRLEQTAGALPANHVGKPLTACVLEQWHLANRQLATAPRTIATLRLFQQAQSDSQFVMIARGCAILLEALLAAAERRPDAARKLGTLDSLMKTGPPYRSMDEAWNLVTARLFEATGDRASALAATRRRLYDVAEPRFLSTYLREEGRLAALTGDTAGAIRAYRHYLILQADPEPAAQPRVQRVRAEFAILTGGRP